MTKKILLGTIVAITILGLSIASVALNNDVEAGAIVRDPIRDNVDVEKILLKNGQFRVIVDNAGTGGTSDVEITWNFNPKACVVIAAGDVGGFGTIELVDDDAFGSLGIPVGHNDVDFAEAILLGVKGDAPACGINPVRGEFVEVSTIGMGGPGPLMTSNPPEG